MCSSTVPVATYNIPMGDRAGDRERERERELCISVILLLFVKSACKLVETNLQFRIIHLLALSFELKFKAF